MEANSAPANAPTSICPSIATLMTPERSQTMPASAPRISGIASRIEFCSSPVRPIGLAESPVPAQHRNATTKQHDGDE